MMIAFAELQVKKRKRIRKTFLSINSPRSLPAREFHRGTWCRWGWHLELSKVPPALYDGIRNIKVNKMFCQTSFCVVRFQAKRWINFIRM
jgi:hypothetical protein